MGALTRFLALVLGSVVFLTAQPLVNINLPAGHAPLLTRRRGQYSTRNQRLIDAIAYAYGIGSQRIFAPGWFLEARYDFTVDAAGSDPKPLLREALKDRFAINAGFQTRPVETWVMEFVRSERTLESAGSEYANLSVGPRGIQGTATFEILAGMLQRILRTEVAYETGIGGVFRFSLSWPEDNSDSVIRALRDAGIELSKEYRDGNVLVVYSAFWPDAPQPPQHSCGPGPSVRSAIESLPRSIEAATPVDERMEPVRKLLEEYPQNLFVEMAAQDLFFDQPGFTVWRGRALSRYRGMQDQTGGAFLQARLQSYLEPKDSLNILEAILQKEPAFPSAHLLAAALSRPGVAKNKHLAGFRQLCTGSLEDAALYGDVRDPELLRLAVAAFTRTLGEALRSGSAARLSVLLAHAQPNRAVLALELAST